MHADLAAVQSLTAKLTAPAREPLTPDERTLAAAALAQLAADQALILRLQRLLALHAETDERTDAALRRAADTLAVALSRPSPARGYDADAARRAREELADAVADARSARQVIAAALAFAREVAALV